MKKLVISALVLALALILAACGDSAGGKTSGGGLGNITVSRGGTSSTAAQSSQPTQSTGLPTATELPGGSIDEYLVGNWSHSSSGYRYGTTNWYTTTERFVFSSDGTYSYYYETSDQSKGAKNGTRYERGIYSVNGNEISFTNIESRWEASDSNTVSTGWEVSKSYTDTYRLEEWLKTYRLILGNTDFYQ